jgi:hypothetical protein
MLFTITPTTKMYVASFLQRIQKLIDYRIPIAISPLIFPKIRTSRSKSNLICIFKSPCTSAASWVTFLAPFLSSFLPSLSSIRAPAFPSGSLDLMLAYEQRIAGIAAAHAILKGWRCSEIGRCLVIAICNLFREVLGAIFRTP